MKSILFFAALALALFQQTELVNDYAKTTLVKAGENAPGFVCQTLTGKIFSLVEQKGKVVLINFFATW